MVLIGASCTLPVVGRAGPGLRLAVGIGAGFAVHVAAQVVAAIGVSGRLPVLLAAWVPVAVALLLGGTTLLCLEER